MHQNIAASEFANIMQSPQPGLRRGCACVQACTEASQIDDPGPESDQNALYVSHVLACGRMPDALAAAFLCGLPGFAVPTAALLCQEVQRNPFHLIILTLHI